MQEKNDVLVKYMLASFSGPKAILLAAICYLTLLSFDNSFLSHTDDSLSARHGNPFKTFKGRAACHLLAFSLAGSLVLLESSYIEDRTTLDLNLKVYLGASCFSIFFFIVLEFWKSKTFSGLPYLNDDKRKRSKAIKSRILIFMLGKVLDCTVSLFLILRTMTSLSDFEDWISATSIRGSLFYIVCLFLILIGEVWPAFKCLQSSFTDLLQKDGSHHNIQLLVDNPSKLDTFFQSTLSSKGSKSATPRKDASISVENRMQLSNLKNIKIGMLHIKVVFIIH